MTCEGVPAPVTAALFGNEGTAAKDLLPETEVVLTWDPADVVLLEGTNERKEDLGDLN